VDAVEVPDSGSSSDVVKADVTNEVETVDPNAGDKHDEVATEATQPDAANVIANKPVEASPGE
jgi:hypothetical protein